MKKFTSSILLSFALAFFSLMLAVPAFAAPSLTITNSTADIISLQGSSITISGTVTEPDAARIVTITANIGGVWKSVQLNSPLSNAAWSLTWTHAEMSYGIHTNIVFTANNGAGGTATATYTGNITVDRTDPVCSTGTWSPSSSPWKLTPATQEFTLSGVQDSALHSSGMNVSGGSCTAASTHGSTCTVVVSDLAGNSVTCVSPPNRIDGENPTPTCSITAISNPQYQYVSGNTVYFNTLFTGSFSITAGITPPISGVQNVTFPALGSGWNPSTSAVDATSPYQQTYAWTSSAASSPTARTVTALYGNGLSNTCDFVALSDFTAPAGGSITYSTQYKTAVVGQAPTMTIDEGTETGSGINIASRKLQRSIGDLSNNACSNYSTFADTTFTGTFPNISDAGVITDKKCYRYRWLVSDNVGNTVTYASSNEFKIDTTAPATTLNTIDVTGTNVFYKAGNTTVYYKTPSTNQTFTIRANASDLESGIAKVTFPDIATTGFSSADPAEVTTSPYLRQYTISSAASSPSPGSQTVTGQNNAGLNTTFNYSVVYDDVDPSTGTVSCPSNYSHTGTYNVTGNAGTDTLSGVDTAASYFQVRSATLSNDTCDTFGGYTNTGSPAATNLSQTPMASGQCYEYRYYTQDMVGNSSVSSSCVIKVDTLAPTCGDWIPADPVAPKSTRSAQLFTLVNSTDDHSGMADVSYECTAVAIDGQSCDVTIYDQAGNSTVCTSPQNNIQIPPPMIPTLSNQVAGHNLVWNYIELSPDWVNTKIYGRYPRTDVPINYELILTIPTIDKSYPVNLTTSTTTDTHFEFVIPVSDFNASREDHTFVGPQKLKITDIDNDKITIIDYNTTFYFPVYHLNHIANMGYYIFASENQLNPAAE